MTPLNAIPRLLAVLGLALAMAACSKEYSSSDLGPESPQGQQVRQMIADLRQAGPDGMDSVLARDGAADQLPMLKPTLLPLVQADDAQLTALTRYGDNVFAASITLTRSGKTAALDMLIVEKDNTLKWAGRQ